MFSAARFIRVIDQMRGLKNCRDEFGPCKPFKGARITVSSNPNFFTPLFIKTLTALGAEVRWCSSSFLPDQDQIATATAGDGASVCTGKGETRQENCWCINRALDWGLGSGPDLIVDDGGVAILLILEGLKAEEIYAKTGQLPDPCSTDNTELQTVLTIIRDGLKTNPKRFHNMKQRLVGICLGITNCVERLLRMQANGTLSVPVINTNDSVTNSKFSYFGCQYALLDEIKRATNMTISGKRAVVCGYHDEASEGCAMALKKAGANVVVYEVDPIYALRARLRGFSVINQAPDNVVSEADILVANFNKDNNDVHSCVKNLKNNAFIYNTGNVKPCLSGMQQFILDSHTDKWVSSDTNKCVIVVSNPGYPNLMPSWYATRHVVAMLEFMSHKETGKYKGKVYAFPEHLEEKVSDLHLGELKAVVAKKETEEQAVADLASVPSQERANPFTTTTTEAMNMSKMLMMVIQVVPIIGALAYALSKVSKAELSFSAIWGGGN